MVASFPRHGELWFVQLSPSVGHEQYAIRPWLIVSVDHFNSLPSAFATILPIPSRDRGISWHYRIEAGIGGLSKTSFVICEQVRAISSRRFARRIGSLP